MTEEHDKLVTFNANSETAEEAKEKLEHGELSERLRETLDEIAHGADVAHEQRLLDRLQTHRKERRKAEKKIREWQDERDELDLKIERVEARLDELRDRDGEYEGMLAMLEEDLHAGERVMTGTDKVRRAANRGDCTPEDVINDLKERNPDVPEAAYRQSRPSEPPKWTDMAEHGGGTELSGVGE